MDKANEGQSNAPKNELATTVGKGTCFVIMPFGGWFDEYYRTVYAPAIKEAGLVAHRADDLLRSSSIINDVWSYTKRTQIILADLTTKNPNVFYELGLAHALAKPAILVSQSLDDVPFDLRGLRVLIYEKNDPNWGNDLRSKIGLAINEILTSPKKYVLPTFFNLEDLPEKPEVTQQEKDVLSLKQQVEALRREMPTTNHYPIVLPLYNFDSTDISSRIRRYIESGFPVDTVVSYLAPEGISEEYIRSIYALAENDGLWSGVPII